MRKQIGIFIRNLKYKREIFSEISRDIAQIFFGVFAVESLTKEIISWKLVLIGVLLSLVWWIFGFISYKIK